MAQKKDSGDLGESISLMEPMLIHSRCKARDALIERVFELQSKAITFRASIPAAIVQPLADLVRSANCYYSNFIEGRVTKPIDIERALNEDFSKEPEKRNLQLEAKAHIAVQAWIDDDGLNGEANSLKSILEVHKRFCEQLPDELLWVEDKRTGRRERVVPGAVRNFNVAVGDHEAVSYGAVPRFLNRYEHVYNRLEPAQAVLSAAAAHHRLLWVHPFADGNGRVTRLISYATLLYALNSGGLWSIARGLARRKDDYLASLAACDQTRPLKSGGIGHLNEGNLSTFTGFFLNVCIDQIDFMSDLMKPQELERRVLKWVKTEEEAKRLPNKSSTLLEILLYRGEIPRKEVPSILDLQERQAQRVLADLRAAGAISSVHHKAPWRLHLSARLAPAWVPGIYP
jgi:Fic family protein